jgi:formylglycine-generating enzyme
MNKSTAFIFIAFLFITVSAFIGKSNSTSKSRDILKNFIQLNDKLFIDRYEVSNFEYRQFLASLKEAHQNDLYNRCLLDTDRWSDKFAAMKLYYHSHKAYDQYPVVTVSYDGASEYCKWLTAQYNSDPDRKFKKIIFRLPTEQEWVDAATGGNKNKMYPWDNYYLRNKKGEYLCNFLRLGDQAISYDPDSKSYKVMEEFIESAGNSLLSPVNSFPPGPSGIYNFSGNAAEMVSQKGLAKGGSYNDPGYDVRISSKKYYDGASPEIGFRVMMEIQEK